MNGQIVVDGVLTGAMVGLGAVGLTMVYSILRFANFTHGDYVSAGAYIALVVADALAVRLGAWGQSLGALTFGLPLIVALVVAMGADRPAGAGNRLACCSAGCAGTAARWCW